MHSLIHKMSVYWVAARWKHWVSAGHWKLSLFFLEGKYILFLNILFFLSVSTINIVWSSLPFHWKFFQLTLVLIFLFPESSPSSLIPWCYINFPRSQHSYQCDPFIKTFQFSLNLSAPARPTWSPLSDFSREKPVTISLDTLEDTVSSLKDFFAFKINSLGWKRVFCDPK